jgi:hypothetical protein
MMHETESNISFSWDCDTPIPAEILGTLQQRFPKAQLHANVRSTHPILLSSTQLYRLHVSVPCGDISGAHAVSMFRVIKQALMRLPNIRHLHIDTHYDPSTLRLLGATLECLQLPLELGDRLPVLKTLGSLVQAIYLIVTIVCSCSSLYSARNCSSLHLDQQIQSISSAYLWIGSLT